MSTKMTIKLEVSNADLEVVVLRWLLENATEYDGKGFDGTMKFRGTVEYDDDPPGIPPRRFGGE